MQLEITLNAVEESLMGFDYQYEFHSMLMQKLSTTQPELAADLHDGKHRNRIKLFVFSPLNSLPNPKLVQVENESRKRMLLGEKIWFRLASPVPEFINNLAEALLTAGTFGIGTKQFKVRNISMIAPPEMRETMVWRPFGQAGSICTAWTAPVAEKKLFRYPDYQGENDNPGCAELLTRNLYHKFQRLQEIRPDIAQAWLATAGLKELSPSLAPIKVEFLPLAAGRAYRTMLHRGKNDVIKSWRCPVQVTAPIPVQRLIWAAGLGVLGSQGYGLCQEGKSC